MEIFIVAVITGLGLLIGMFFIWQGYQPPHVSTTRSDGISGDGENRN
ncbi:hypothetical protein [Candidatus Nitrospira salsa]